MEANKALATVADYEKDAQNKIVKSAWDYYKSGANG